MRNPNTCKEFAYGRICTGGYALGKEWDTFFDWMKYIFAGKDVRCNTYLNRADAAARGISEDEYEKWVIDCKVEELNLCIFFDNLEIYRSPYRMVSNEKRDAWLCKAGYKVVHVPFFVQMSPEIIEHFFGIQKAHGCKYPSGWYPRETEDYHFETTPANFCELGFNHMCHQIHELPKSCRDEIFSSLQALWDDWSVNRNLVFPPNQICRIRISTQGNKAEILNHITRYKDLPIRPVEMTP